MHLCEIFQITDNIFFMIILYFFLAHWFLSLFTQTFFLHRYSSHKMFKMTPFWEKFFYLFTFISQGASFLNPRAYAIMHRMHHAYRLKEPEAEFKGNYPTWALVDRIGDDWKTRIGFGIIYTAIYVGYATSPWLFLLLPIHYLMGPMHGALVNWCGHKYGYSNFDNGDKSKNTTPWGFLMLGELFQNNHHKFPNSPKFASKWYEIDPTYYMMLALDRIRVIKIRKK